MIGLIKSVNTLFFICKLAYFFGLNMQTCIFFGLVLNASAFSIIFICNTSQPKAWDRRTS